MDLKEITVSIRWNFELKAVTIVSRNWGQEQVKSKKISPPGKMCVKPVTADRNLF